jgi:hypothetical protein
VSAGTRRLSAPQPGDTVCVRTPHGHTYARVIEVRHRDALVVAWYGARRVVSTRDLYSRYGTLCSRGAVP